MEPNYIGHYEDFPSDFFTDEKSRPASLENAKHFATKEEALANKHSYQNTEFLLDMLEAYSILHPEAEVRYYPSVSACQAEFRHHGLPILTNSSDIMSIYEAGNSSYLGLLIELEKIQGSNPTKETLFENLKNLRIKELEKQQYTTGLLRYFNSSMISASMIEQYVYTTTNDNDFSLKMYDYFLKHKEELSSKINEHNLKLLQKHYGDRVRVVTEECRISKTRPKASSAKYLVSEKISEYDQSEKSKYYKIEREYHIPIKDTNSLAGYRSSFRFAKRLKFNSNTKTQVFHTIVPHVQASNIAYNCNLENTIKEVRTYWKEEVYDNTDQFSSTDRYSDRLLATLARRLYPQYREKTLPLIKKIVVQRPKDISYHDFLYPYLDIPHHLLTPSVAKAIYEAPASEAEKWSILKNYSGNNESYKQLRKQIYLGFKKQETPEEICVRLENVLLDNIKIHYQLSHEQLEMITKNYLPVIQRYNRHCTTTTFLSTFGKRGIKKILGKNEDALFTPKEYRLPSMEKTVLASMIHERIGSLQDKENLSTRKKLYNKLNQLYPMKQLLAGNFPEEIIPDIKKALNLSPHKKIEYASDYSARIEKKCSPEFLIAGDASVCCMSLGTAKAIDYALQPGFGIFNVYFKDRIIANSLIWENKVGDKKVLVIDNIEVHPNYQKYDSYIKEMYHQLINDMKNQYDCIVQGSTYNDLELYEENTSVFGSMKEWSPQKINKTNFYSDAQDSCFCIYGDSNCLISERHNFKNYEDYDANYELEDLDFDSPPEEDEPTQHQELTNEGQAYAITF